MDGGLGWEVRPWRALCRQQPGPIERSLRIGNLADIGDRYQIRRLLSPRDESIDLSETEWLAALKLTRAEWQADPGRGQGEEAPRRAQRKADTRGAPSNEGTDATVSGTPEG